jgi:AcrR family transcriptional regulator
MRERGVSSVSTEDVQEAADVSASQLYHYFGDKGNLIRAVVAYQAETLIDAHSARGTQLDSLAGLREWRDYVIDAQKTQYAYSGCPLGSFTSQVADRWPSAREEIADGFARWQTLLREGLERMQQRGELHSDADPHRLSLAALATVQGGIVLGQANRNTEALEAALDEFLAHVESLAAR